MQLHMQKRWTYTDRGARLISITVEEKKTVYYLDWSNDLHTKVNTVDYLYWGNDRNMTRIPSIIFIGIMTNIRKKIPSIIFIGIMTNIRKEIPSIIFIGIMTNIRKTLGTWEYTGKNCLGGTCHLKSTWLVTFLNYITGNETFDKRKTCKLSVWLMKACWKSTWFRKRSRQNPLGLAQDVREPAWLGKHLRESTRLGKHLRESTRLGKTFARIHPAW